MEAGHFAECNFAESIDMLHMKEADTSEKSMNPNIVTRVGNMKIALFLLCVAIISQSMMVSGALNVCISTIERVFRYKSFHVAFIDTSYNIGFAISSFLLGSYVTSRKTKWIGIGMFLFSIGCLIFISPLLLLDKIGVVSKQESVLCLSKSQQSELNCAGSPKSYLFIMCMAYAIMGIGAAPLHTIAVTFIQEHTSDSQNGLYNGIYYASAAVGPAFLFVVYSFVAKIPFNLFYDPNNILTSADENWIGAYWLIYIFGAVCAVSVSIPIYIFPTTVRSHRTQPSQNQVPFSLRRFLMISRRIMHNKQFIFICLAMLLDGMMNNAIGVFLAKYIEIQFQITSDRSALFSGMIIVFGAVVGLFAGGLIIRFFHCNAKTLVKRITFASILGIIALFFLFFRCEENPIYGVKYNNDRLVFDTGSLSDQCHCDITKYFPVCINSTNSYYNACAIGCRKQETIDGTMYFKDCSNTYAPKNIEVTKGRCVKGCSAMGWFMFCGFLCLVIEFLIYVPQITYTMKILDDQSRLFGISIQQIFVRVSYMLGPLYQGPLFDYSCRFFSPLLNCESSSNCINYDLKKLSLSMALPAIALKMGATIFLLLSYLSVKPPNLSISPDSYTAVEEAT